MTVSNDDVGMAREKPTVSQEIRPVELVSKPPISWKKNDRGCYGREG